MARDPGYRRPAGRHGTAGKKSWARSGIVGAAPLGRFGAPWAALFHDPMHACIRHGQTRCRYGVPLPAFCRCPFMVLRQREAGRSPCPPRISLPASRAVRDVRPPNRMACMPSLPLDAAIKRTSPKPLAPAMAVAPTIRSCRQSTCEGRAPRTCLRCRRDLSALFGRSRTSGVKHRRSRAEAPMISATIPTAAANRSCRCAQQSCYTSIPPYG